MGRLSMSQTDTSPYPRNLLLLPYPLFSQRPSPLPQSCTSAPILMFTTVPSSLSPLPPPIPGTQSPWPGLSQKPPKLSTLHQSLLNHCMHCSLVNLPEALFYSATLLLKNLMAFHPFPERRAHIP